MNKNITFSSHIIALTAIFVLGNGCLYYPKGNANEYGFTAYIISGVLLVLAYLSVSLLWGRVNVNQNSGVWGKIIYSVVILSIGIFALFCGAESFLSIINFIGKIVLPKTSKFFISLILGLVVLYFATRPKDSILKFSLITIVLVTAVVLFFFLVPTDKYDLRNIFIFRLPKLNDLIRQMKPYLINPLLHSLIVPVFLKFTLGKTATKQGVFGTVLGIVLLGFCILTPVLLFGAKVAGGPEFPFSSAVSTVTVGRLFTRLDGFAYFVFFVSAVVKITVCVNVCSKAVKNIRELL